MSDGGPGSVPLTVPPPVAPLLVGPGPDAHHELLNLECERNKEISLWPSTIHHFIDPSCQISRKIKMFRNGRVSLIYSIHLTFVVASLYLERSPLSPFRSPAVGHQLKSLRLISNLLGQIFINQFIILHEVSEGETLTLPWNITGCRKV